MRKLPLILLVLSVWAAQAAPDWTLPSGAKAFLLNSPDQVDEAKINPLLEEVIRQAVEGELVPSKVLIASAHPIVREAVSSPAILLKFGDQQQTILLPLAHKGGRVILIKGKDYVLCALPEKSKALGFEKCITRPPGDRTAPGEFSNGLLR